MTITTGKTQYSVQMSWKTYQTLGNKAAIALRKERDFKERTFKTDAEAQAFAKAERERTGLDITVQECTPIYGLF
jgi:phosphoenolpyruvate synthase/pyruvate phosphate dikinase